MRRIAFDTSALGRVQHVAPTRFYESLARHDVRPANTASTIQSLLGKPSNVIRQMERLAELGFGRFPQLSSARMVLNAEKRGERMTSPRYYAWELQIMFDQIREDPWRILGKQRNVRRLLVPRLPVQNHHLLDWWERQDKNERRTRVRDLRTEGISGRDMKELLHRVLTADGGEEFAARALADRASHRASLLGAGLRALYFLSRVMHAEYTPRQPWLKVEPDDRFDLNIAVEAAYCDAFVSDDRHLISRLEFLATEGLVRFTVMTTPGFLEEASNGSS